VNGSEFLRKAKRFARKRDLTYRWRPERGVGSHGTLYVGEKYRVVKDLRKDLEPDC
jgi:mRNA interferase HicA